MKSSLANASIMSARINQVVASYELPLETRRELLASATAHWEKHKDVDTLATFMLDARDSALGLVEERV